MRYAMSDILGAEGGVFSYPDGTVGDSNCETADGEGWTGAARTREGGGENGACVRCAEALVCESFGMR
jgi:hypothetical protein